MKAPSIPASTTDSQKTDFIPITPFHIREQLFELVNGPESVSEKIYQLLTKSRSPYKIREKLLGKPHTKVDFSTVASELQTKLDIEGKAKGIHLGIICDGNRRWAEKRGLDKTEGHKNGYKTVEDVIFPTISKIPQISELSVYLLSTSNLKRENRELDNIYQLFEYGYENLINIANKHNIQYRHAGKTDGLPEKMQTLLSNLEKETAHNNGVKINLCINYDATEEEGEATKKFVLSISRKELESMSPREIAHQVQKHSWIATPVDAVLRTGGDPRFSGFVGNRPYDINCHLLVEPKFLPDLTEKDILEHLFHFAKGERRMGQ